MRRHLVLGILPALLLAGCATPPVPKELPAATAAQAKAIEAVAETQRVIVLAYDKELRRVFGQLLDAQLAAQLAAAQTGADGEEVVTTKRAAEIIAARNAAHERINAQLDVKRDQFLSDGNLMTVRELNAAVTRWVQVYAIDFGLEVQNLTTEVLGLIGAETPKITITETTP